MAQAWNQAAWVHVPTEPSKRACCPQYTEDQAMRQWYFAERTGFMAGMPSKETGGEAQKCLSDRLFELGIYCRSREQEGVGAKT